MWGDGGNEFRQRPTEVAAKESVLRGYQSVFPTALAINPRVPRPNC